METSDRAAFDPEDSTLGHGQIQAGGLNAQVESVWGQFYEHCFTIIRQCPNVRRLSDADREDCVQDVMIEIVRRFGEASNQPSPDPRQITGWIRAVSRNKAVDISRRRQRRNEVFLGEGADPAAAEPKADAGSYVSLVWEALLALDHDVPVTSYLVFYLHTIEGWPSDEIAELFQITAEQARVRSHRVKKKFATHLAVAERRRDRAPDGDG
ncbi:MAG: sigma-70 family RNA polymerase sigma factor [Isosphaeraceae bacterium]